MKTTSLKYVAALLAVGSLTLSASTVLAQDSSATTTTAQAAPQLPYGVSQIMQLEQAKVGDDTIVAYIRNSGNSYGLNADQIIYLRQQGVSSVVMNAMLSQPAPGALAANSAPTYAQPTTDYASQPTYSQPVSSPSIVGPSVTAIDPSAVAAANYYYYPTYYQPYYYPAYGYGYGYGYYPGVSVSFGWRGGWGGGYRGGYGGFHGIGGGGFHGGGFHGGSHR